MNCKPQEAPEAVFLSSFFFCVFFFLSFQFLFPAIVQVETQIVCFACLSVSDCRPVGKENETKEQIQALSQTPIWVPTCLQYQYVQLIRSPSLGKTQTTHGYCVLVENWTRDWSFGFCSERSHVAISKTKQSTKCFWKYHPSHNKKKGVFEMGGVCSRTSHVICSSTLIWRKVPIPAASPYSANTQTWCFRYPPAIWSFRTTRTTCKKEEQDHSSWGRR